MSHSKRTAASTKFRPPRPPDPGSLPPCRICEDKASGFHYGANTCGACKTFFFRCLKKQKPLLCVGGGENCVMHYQSKKDCNFCRYKKCLACGMSKEGIRTGRYPYTYRTKTTMEIQEIKYDVQQKQDNADITTSPTDHIQLSKLANGAYVDVNELSPTISDSSVKGVPMSVLCVDLSPGTEHMSSCEQGAATVCTPVIQNRGQTETEEKPPISIFNLSRHYSESSDIYSKSVANEREVICSNVPTEITCAFARNNSRSDSDENRPQIEDNLYFETNNIQINHVIHNRTSASGNLQPAVLNPIPESDFDKLSLREHSANPQAILSHANNHCVESGDSDEDTKDDNIFRVPLLSDSERDDIITAVTVAHRKHSYLTPILENTRILEEMQRKYYEEQKLKEEIFGVLRPLSHEEHASFMEATGIDLEQRDELLAYMLQVWESESKKLVLFAKCIPGFMDLGIADQGTLLKACCLECAVLEHFRGYNPMLAIAFHPDGKLFPLKDLFFLCDVGFINHVMQCSLKLCELRLTTEEISLLIAIAILFRDRAPLDDPEAVESLQLKMIYSFRYMLTQNHDNPTETFYRTWDQLITLRYITQNSFEAFISNLLSLSQGQSVSLLLELLSGLRHEYV